MQLSSPSPTPGNGELSGSHLGLGPAFPSCPLSSSGHPGGGGGGSTAPPSSFSSPPSKHPAGGTLGDSSLALEEAPRAAPYYLPLKGSCLGPLSRLGTLPTNPQHSTGLACACRCSWFSLSYLGTHGKLCLWFGSGSCWTPWCPRDVD